MKSIFSVGDRVIDDDGDIAIVENIYEREDAPNQIGIKYLYDLDGVEILVTESDIERIDG